MIASAIREFAASASSTLIAAAFFQEVVQIWDVASQEKINECETIFCAGARNLAISPLEGLLVTGSSKSHGKVAGYNFLNGKQVWEQPLAYPSSLRLQHNETSIWCTESKRSVLRLDIQTGSILERISSAKRYIDDSSGDALIVEATEERPALRIIGEGRITVVRDLSASILDAQFSPHSLCVSEARGPVSCISRENGRIEWTFDPGAGSHVLKLHYSLIADAFFGVLWEFERGGLRRLLRWDPQSGSCAHICDFDSWEEVFVNELNVIVTSAGEIRDLSSGMLAGKLAFPTKEYPDG